MRQRRALRVQERDRRRTASRRRTGRSLWRTRWRSVSDAFFYRLGEKFWIDETTPVDRAEGQVELKADLEQFGFGADSGIAPAVRVGRPDPRRRGQEGARRATRCSARARRPVCWSATTCRSRSARACWPPRRCSWPTRTRRSPTAASSCQPHDRQEHLRAADPRPQRPASPTSPQARSSQSFDTPRDQAPAGDAARASATRSSTASARVTNATRQQRSGCHLPDEPSTTRPPARALFQTTRGRPADRRQDRHRAGRQQLPVERLVGVRRVQPRREPGRTPWSPTSRRAATGRRPRRRS